MVHGIEVHLMADIQKYKQGMAAAKQIGTESMGFIASVFDKIKSMAAGMWDAFKSIFSGFGSSSKGAFDSMSTAAAGAFQKMGAMLPGFNAGLDKTKDKLGETEEKSDSLAKKIGVGLVVAITAAAAAMTMLVKKGLEADAALASVSASGNLAASQISRFEATAARSNVSATEFAGSMVKLREEMKKAAAGSGGDVFDKMGVTIVDANNALLKTDDVTIEVAKKIAAMSTEAEKYAAASKLGFEGKVQVLEDIARASDLSASTTDEQAAAVVRLGKIWHDILPGGKSMWSQISSFLTTSLTPAMTEASVGILAAKNKITAAFTDIFGAGSMFPALGEKIKDWSTQASKWFTGVAESAASATVKMMQFIAAKTGIGNANAPLTTAPGAIPAAVPLASDNKKSITKDDEKEYKALAKAIQEKTEAQRLELQTGAALTEGQRMAIKMAVDLRDGTLKLTDAQKIERSEMLTTLIAQEKANAAAAEARKNSASAAEKEGAAFASIIASIKSRTEAGQLELATGMAATESEKENLKITAALASGKLKLSEAHLVAVRAALQEQAVIEEQVKSQNAQKEVTKHIVASTQARDEATRALDAEYAMYGKSSDARELAMVAVKSETEMQKQLDTLREKHLPITDQILTQLRAERDARTLVGQATLGQTKTLAYANQLKEENAKFAAESLADPKARADALLAIDAEVWRKRIDLAEKGTEARRLLEAEYNTWYANQSKKSLAGVDLTRATDLLKIMEAVDDAARQAAAGMEASFGRVGAAIGGLTTALTGYGKQQQTIAAQLAAVKADPNSNADKISKAEIAASKASAQAQVKSYGDMAGAAKGFFKENTAGYKLMQGTEKAFRAAEMAMAIESMLTKSGLVEAFTGLFVASKATEVGADTAATGTSIANSLARATASTIAGVAKAFEQMGVYGFIGAAAIIAFMAGMGSSASGGGGAAPTTFEDRQKKQGTGTVLGDDTAKSESIANSLAIIEANSGLELNYQNSMLQALKNIESALGGAAKGIFQTAGLTGGSAFGTTNESTKSFFGADKSTTITDTGIKFSGSLGDLRAGAGKGIQYEDVTKTSDGGWFHGNSSSNSTNTKALSDAALKPFTLIFDNMGDLLVGAGVKLGADSKGLNDAINQIGIDFAVSTRDLKGQDLVDALSAGVSVAFDQVTTSVFPQIAQFQKVGEGMGETLVRVASNYAAVDSILASSGVTFGKVGMDSIAAREKLIDFAGGIDALASKTTSFNENFLTQAEQLGPVQKYVTDQLAAMGLQGIDTRDKFKDTVLGLASSGALATEAGAQQYAGLLNLADAFAKTHAATEDLTLSQQEIADQHKDLQDQYDELTMTSTQLRDKEALTIAASNKPLWDKVQAELAAKAAVEETSTILGLQAQMYEANGNKAGAALVVEQQRAIALADLTPAVVAATQATWAAQDAEKARKDALTINNGILANDLAYYQAIGDTAGVAATAQKQWEAALAAMDPALRESATRAHDAQAAATESNAILSAQASMYEAAGDKAGAAAVLQAQHTAALVGMTPALAAATQAMWDAQAAAKAKADALTISNGILANEAAYYEAVNDKAGAARIAQQQWLATLAAMDPALRASATKAHDAQLQQKATADAVAESNTILGLQAQMYDAANDKAGAAIVLEKQRTAALVGLTPAVIAATKATWAAQDAEKARAEALTESNGILAAQASMYEASGDKAGAARVLELQRAAAIKEMTPDLALATQAMWDAQDAEKARNKALADSSAVLGLQLQMYEAQGDKAGAALIVSLQRAAELEKIYADSPAVAEATLALWNAQDAAKAAADQLAGAEAMLGVLGSTFEAQGNKAALLANQEQQRLIALSKLTPELAAATRAMWNAQDAAAAHAAALAEANTILGIQAQIADATGDAVLAATVLEKQRAAALVELSPAVAAVTRELWAVTDAAKAAAQATELAGQKRALDIQLMEALGDAAGALAAKRADELAAMDAGLRGTQQLIYAAEDAAAAQTAAKAATDAAMQAVQRAVDAERTRIGVIRDAAAESVESIKSVFDVLKSAVTDLYGTVSSTAIMQASQGNAFIDNALATVLSSGYLPDSKELADAIAAARGGLDASQFATQFEADRAALVMAGKLSQLQVASGTQLSVAERSLKAAEEQLKALDAQLAAAQQQVDLLRGVNTGVLSVVAAIGALTAAVGRESAGAVPTTPSTSLPTAPGVPIKGWDGGMVPPTDVLNGSANLPGVPDTTAMSKAQLDYFNLLSVTPGQGSGQELVAYVKALQDVQALSSMESLMGIKNDPHESADAFMVRHGYKLDALATDPKQRYSFAVGTNFVPYDMVAQIHEGEAIIPRAFNPAAGGSGWGGSTERLERQVEILTAKLELLLSEGNKNTAKVAGSTEQLADQFDNVTEGGNVMRMEEA